MKKQIFLYASFLFVAATLSACMNNNPKPVSHALDELGEYERRRREGNISISEKYASSQKYCSGPDPARWSVC